MMEFPKTFNEEIEEDGIIISVNLIEVKNAVVALFTEGREVRLGTLVAALPIKAGEETSSSVLLGEKFATVTRVVAEQLAGAFNKIAIVSTYVSTLNDVKAGIILTKVVKKTVQKIKVA